MSRVTQRSFDELPGSMPASKQEKYSNNDFKVPKYAYEGKLFYEMSNCYALWKWFFFR